MSPIQARRVLNVQPFASADCLKEAFKQAAFKYHPDRYHEVDAVERFREVTEAYKVLSTAQPRTTSPRVTPRQPVRGFHRPVVDPNSDTYKLIKGLGAAFFGRKTVEEVEDKIRVAETVTIQSMREAFDLLGVEFEEVDVSSRRKKP